MEHDLQLSAQVIISIESTSASTSQKISAGIPIASQLSLKQTKPLDCYAEPYHHALKMLKLEHTKPWSVLNSNMEQKPGIHTHPPQYKDWNRYRKRLHVLYIVTTGEVHLPLRSF